MTGTFEGEPDPLRQAYYILDVEPNAVVYTHAGGTPSAPFDAQNGQSLTQIQARGDYQVDGLHFTFEDSTGDFYFQMYAGAYARFQGVEEDGVTPFFREESVNKFAWELSPDFHIPDGGSTGLMMGAGLLGMAGVRKASKRWGRRECLGQAV